MAKKKLNFDKLGVDLGADIAGDTPIISPDPKPQVEEISSLKPKSIKLPIGLNNKILNLFHHRLDNMSVRESKGFNQDALFVEMLNFYFENLKDEIPERSDEIKELEDRKSRRIKKARSK